MESNAGLTLNFKQGNASVEVRGDRFNCSCLCRSFLDSTVKNFNNCSQFASYRKSDILSWPFTECLF